MSREERQEGASACVPPRPPTSAAPQQLRAAWAGADHPPQRLRAEFIARAHVVHAARPLQLRLVLSCCRLLRRRRRGSIPRGCRGLVASCCSGLGGPCSAGCAGKHGCNISKNPHTARVQYLHEPRCPSRQECSRVRYNPHGDPQHLQTHSSRTAQHCMARHCSRAHPDPGSAAWT